MKTKKRTKIVSLLAAALILCAALLSAKGAAATTLQQDQITYQKLQSELNSLKKERQSITSELGTLRSDYANRQRVVELLYQEIASYQNELGVLADLILEYNNLIDTKKAQIEELNQKIEHNYELFKERLVFAQESGTMSYIDFILGAEDLSDIMSRGEVINDMLAYDRQIIQEIGTARDEVVLSKKEVEEALADCEARKAEYDAIMETLNQKIAEAEAYVDDIKDDVERTETKNALLQSQQTQLEAQLKKLEKEMEEKRKQEAARQAAQQQQQGGSTGTTTPAYTGTYIWPLPLSFPGWISQYFGGSHTGLDIHVGGWGNNGKIPALACAAGTVIRCGMFPSWGNLVIVDHGGGVHTYYAHLYRIDVSVGQKVAQGQQVGMIGSTGNSTGPHLHICFVINGVRKNPLNYIRRP